MTLDAQHRNDGRTHLFLTPIEKGVLAAVGAALLAFVYWLVASVSALLTTAQVTSQQVAGVQQQVTQLNTQMQDVAAVKLRVAELSIQVEQNKQDIQELRQLRGLK